MMKNAERILAAYAQSEPWKADHNGAMRCFEAEEVVAVGNLAYKLISFMDATWQDRVMTGNLPYRDEDGNQIGEFYRMWVEVTERNLDEIESLVREGYVVQGSDALLIHLEEARSLVEALALEAVLRPVEEILPMAHGNPRPERYGK